MYENVNAEEMLAAVDSWHPVWFAVEDGALMVDLCVNYRLTDGKVRFIQFFSTDPQELSRVANEVAKAAKENWVKTIDEMTQNLGEQIEEVAQAEKIIASVQWVEGEKYLITYHDSEQVTYECTVSCDKDIYVIKVLPEDESFMQMLNKEVSVRVVVGSTTQIKRIS